MNISCSDRQRIFHDGSADEWAALEVHAATCLECAEEVRVWKAMSTAAEQLRDDRESPTLWTRIKSALAKQAAAKGDRRKFVSDT